MEQMGHGRTADVIGRQFHYYDMAEDTIALMRHLEIDSAVVVGYSDGGIIGPSCSRACSASGLRSRISRASRCEASRYRP